MDAETFMNGNQAIDRGFATGLLPADEVVEDKAAGQRAKAMHAARKIEITLTQKGGLTRSQARALMKDLHRARSEPGADATGTTPGAGANATHDAGNGESWITDAKALIQRINA
jgi:hypothetical protein